MVTLHSAARTAVAIGVAFTATLLVLHPSAHGQAPPSSPTPGQPAPSPHAAIATDQRPNSLGHAVVRGRVVEAGTGTPVSGARVFGGGVHRTADEAVFSDATGAFELKGVAEGPALVTASKPGYGGSRGQPSGYRRVTLRSGETIQGVEVVLHRLSAIAGRVLDPAGEPVVGVYVTVHRRPSDGLQPYELAGASVQTDDLGRYRVHSLAPGEYLVGARPPASMRPDTAPQVRAGGARERAVPTYYPAATNVAAASWVTVSGATEATADIALQTDALGSISGTVVARDGRPVPAGAVNVRGAEHSPALRSVTSGFNVGPDGSFAIADVPPGSYRLVAVSRGVDADAAEADIVVEPGEDEIVTLTMTPGATLRGRLTLERGAEEEVASLEVRATALERDRFRFHQVRAHVGADGSFELRGLRGKVQFDVAPGLPPTTTDARRRAPTDASRAWRVRAVRVNGRDLAGNALDSDDPRDLDAIELVAARDFASIGGTAVPPPAVPAGSLVVVAVPAGAARVAHSWPWRNIWTATPSADGQFLLQALPPGDYHVFALHEPEDGSAPLDTDSLAQWRARATRVTLAESQHLELDLRAVRFP